MAGRNAKRCGCSCVCAWYVSARRVYQGVVQCSQCERGVHYQAPVFVKAVKVKRKTKVEVSRNMGWLRRLINRLPGRELHPRVRESFREMRKSERRDRTRWQRHVKNVKRVKERQRARGRSR